MIRPCLAQPQAWSPEAPGAKGGWDTGLPAPPPPTPRGGSTVTNPSRVPFGPGRVGDM